MSEEINKKNWYDKNYKILLVVPTILLIFSLVYLANFNSKHGDLIFKDVSLTGGTSITIFDENINIEDLESSLKNEFSDITTRAISNIRTGKQQAIFVETSADVEIIKSSLEDYLNYSLNSENSSIEFSSSLISQGFYHQLRLALFISFILMAIVVFIVFRTVVPSLAVIISAFADIVMTLTVVNLLGFRMSTAGIIAVLMLIGYSVDTDILLTTRLLKNRGESINRRMIGAFKTGMMMTITSIIAMGAALIIVYSISAVLRQMFTIILIGLVFDMFNTWVTNASILKWYTEAKEK